MRSSATELGALLIVHLVPTLSVANGCSVISLILTAHSNVTRRGGWFADSPNEQGLISVKPSRLSSSQPLFVLSSPSRHLTSGQRSNSMSLMRSFMVISMSMFFVNSPRASSMLIALTLSVCSTSPYIYSVRHRGRGSLRFAGSVTKIGFKATHG